MEKIVIGADIGGSHITCQLFDLDINQPVENSICRVMVNSKASKDEILDEWVSAIRTAAKNVSHKSFSGIGFAMPGPFDYQSGIAMFKGVQKFENLYGVNVRDEIQNRLSLGREFPVRFLNDASCFAVGEAWIGEASKYERIIAITMGTGFGTTFIKNRLPVAGTDGIPTDGFLYHIPFKDSIADDYFSTRWFLEAYFEKTGKRISGVIELVEKMQDETVSTEIFSDFGRNLGDFLAPWIKTFDADCLVLGGNISKSFSLFKTEMEMQFKKHAVNPAVCLSTLEEHAALFGCAKLCDDSFYADLIRTRII